MQVIGESGDIIRGGAGFKFLVGLLYDSGEGPHTYVIVQLAHKHIHADLMSHEQGRLQGAAANQHQGLGAHGIQVPGDHIPLHGDYTSFHFSPRSIGGSRSL